MKFSHEIAVSLVHSDEPFPVKFDYAWRWIGYRAKRNAKEVLLNNFVEGVDFLRSTTKTPTGGRPSETINLTVECFKSLGMMAGTNKGKEIRRYFLQCERIAQAAVQFIPVQGNRIRELELQLAVARAQTLAAQQQRQLGEFNQALLQLHGAPILALILGRPEAVVERPIEIERTVMCTERGTPLARFQGVSKTAMARRYNMKKAAHFEAWLESLGKKDLLVQGMTAVSCEYLPREHVLELDRLWSEQRGERQLLLGE